MSWEETRGSARVAVGAARQVAHADDAKSRVDEATRLPTKSLRPRLLTAVGAGVAVLGLVAFLAFRGGDAAEADRTAPVDTKPSPTAAPSEPSEPTPAEVLAESQPSGEWQVRTFGRTITTRGGSTRKFKDVGDPVVWTFPDGSCTATDCSGTISSSSGKTFAYSWNGRKLVVTRENTTRRDPKQACVNKETGEVQPIESSAARATYRYRLEAFTGTSARLASTEHVSVSYEFFGDCEPGPTDDVAATYEWVMTPAE